MPEWLEVSSGLDLKSPVLGFTARWEAWYLVDMASALSQASPSPPLALLLLITGHWLWMSWYRAPIGASVVLATIVVLAPIGACSSLRAVIVLYGTFATSRVNSMCISVNSMCNSMCIIAWEERIGS